MISNLNVQTKFEPHSREAGPYASYIMIPVIIWLLPWLELASIRSSQLHFNFVVVVHCRFELTKVKSARDDEENSVFEFIRLHCFSDIGNKVRIMINVKTNDSIPKQSYAVSMKTA